MKYNPAVAEISRLLVLLLDEVLWGVLGCD